MRSTTDKKKADGDGSKLLATLCEEDGQDGSVEEILANADWEVVAYVVSCIVLEGAAISFTASRDGSSFGVTVLNGGKKAQRWMGSADALNDYMARLGSGFQEKYPVA